MKAILDRRSIRKYTDQKIDKETIQKILAAGMSAPSARDERPWEFIVVENPETLKDMAQLTPYAGMLANAPLGMVICANTKQHLNMEYDSQDCAAVTENMLVEANYLGIGTCWLGGYPNQDRLDNISNYFKLPEHIQPMWMISFGYPAEMPAKKDKWDETKIHWEQY